MIRSLIPFTQLTRLGVPPEFRVTRLPLLLDGIEIAVGDIVSPQSFPNRVRLRQMYEQRRIEPLVAPKDSRQEARERMERANRERLAASTLPPVSQSTNLPFDSPAVPAVEAAESIPSVVRPVSRVVRRRPIR